MVWCLGHQEPFDIFDGDRIHSDLHKPSIPISLLIRRLPIINETIATIAAIARKLLLRFVRIQFKASLGAEFVEPVSDGEMIGAMGAADEPEFRDGWERL